MEEEEEEKEEEEEEAEEEGSLICAHAFLVLSVRETFFGRSDAT